MHEQEETTCERMYASDMLPQVILLLDDSLRETNAILSQETAVLRVRLEEEHRYRAAALEELERVQNKLLSEVTSESGPSQTFSHEGENQSEYIDTGNKPRGTDNTREEVHQQWRNSSSKCPTCAGIFDNLGETLAGEMRILLSDIRRTQTTLARQVHRDTSSKFLKGIADDTRVILDDMSRLQEMKRNLE